VVTTQQILDSPSRDGFETRLYCANCKIKNTQSRYVLWSYYRGVFAVWIHRSHIM